MAPVDPQILSPRDTLKDGKIRLDGPLMTDATKFGVQCLNLPQSASVIKYLAGIDDPTYNQYADILSKLAKTFVEMFRIGEHFSARLYGLNAACDDIVKFADFAEANFPTLFQYFRDVRDNPSHEAHAQLETLNKQTLIATHNAASLASIVGFEDCVRDWSEQQSKLNEIYDELETRMKDPKIKEIIDRVLKYQGSTPGKGLVNLKDWMRDIDDKTSKAAHDLKLFREGSWTALQGDAADLEQFATEPHSERTNAFMRVELASLLEGWSRVRDEVQKLQKDHLHAALEAIDRAPSMY